MPFLERFRAELKNYTLKRENKKLLEFGLCLEAEIGRGNYSTVFRGNLNSNPVAVKVVDEKKTPPGYVVSFLPREINLSRKIDHKNLLRIDDIFCISKKTFIISELGRFDLLQYLRLKGALRESLSRRLFYDLCNGLDAMHRHGIVHRDIKCENLLIAIDGSLKIADFGFARELQEGELSETFCGSTAYTAPEVLNATNPYDPKLSDIWSCGIVLYTMITGKMPFSRLNLHEIIKSGTTERQLFFPLPYSYELSPDVIDLCLQILKFEAEMRLSLATVLTKKHSWFSMDFKSIRNEQN